MKVSGKGVVVILIFMVAIPVFLDMLLTMLFPNNKETIRMSRLLSSGYIKALPFYITYLIIAFTIYFLIKKWKKSQSR